MHTLVTPECSMSLFFQCLSSIPPNRDGIQPDIFKEAGLNRKRLDPSKYATQVFNSILNYPLDPPTMAPPGMAPGIFPSGLYEDFQSRPAEPDGWVTFSKVDLVAGEGNGACN